MQNTMCAALLPRSPKRSPPHHARALPAPGSDAETGTSVARLLLRER